MAYVEIDKVDIKTDNNFIYGPMPMTFEFNAKTIECTVDGNTIRDGNVQYRTKSNLVDNILEIIQ